MAENYFYVSCSASRQHLLKLIKVKMHNLSATHHNSYKSDERVHIYYYNVLIWSDHADLIALYQIKRILYPFLLLHKL